MADLAKQQIAYRRAVAQGVARADSSVDPAQQLATIRRHKASIDDQNFKKAVRPHSCGYCRPFIIDVSGQQGRLNDEWMPPKLLQFKHINLVHVKHGAQNDCILCGSIIAQLDRNDSSFGHDRDEDLTCFTYMYPGQGGEFDAEAIGPIGVWNDNKVWTKWANKHYHENWQYACVVGDQDPASAFITSRPIQINPASEESFNLMRSWRAECTHGHRDCQYFK